jgi:hypothetical protein
MIELPRLEGKDWDRLARRPYEYAIEGEGYQEPCSLEQALEWARQRAGATDKPVRLAVLWSGEWWLVDIVCPSEFLTRPGRSQPEYKTTEARRSRRAINKTQRPQYLDG